jgi:hypothetical protein
MLSRPPHDEGVGGIVRSERTSVSAKGVGADRDDCRDCRLWLLNPVGGRALRVTGSICQFLEERVCVFVLFGNHAGMNHPVLRNRAGETRCPRKSREPPLHHFLIRCSELESNYDQDRLLRHAMRIGGVTERKMRKW